MLSSNLKKLLIPALSLSVVFSLILAGCSSNSADSGNQGSPGKGGSNQEPVTIVFKSHATEEAKTKELIDLFNGSHDNIKIKYAPSLAKSPDERNKLATMLTAGGKDADIMLLDTYWLNEFAAAGWLEPMDAYLPQGYQDDFFPFANDIVKYNGKQYGVLRQIDLSGIWYNKDLFKKAGITAPPKTIDELVNDAKLTTLNGNFGISWQGGQYEGLICNWIEYYHALGGRMFGDGEVGKREVTFNKNNAAVKATETLKSLLAYSPPGVTSYAEQESSVTFLDGKAAMLRYWHVMGTIANDPSQSKIKDNWGFAPLPSGPDGSHTNIGGWAFGINANSDHKKEAAEVVKFLTDPQQQTWYMLNFGNQPSRQSVYQSDAVKKDPIWSVLAPQFQEIAKTGLPRPLSLVWGQESDELQRALHDVFAGKSTPEQAMASVEEKIKKIEKSQGQ
jgi:multiple sugar transport system substrate-binding protein